MWACLRGQRSDKIRYKDKMINHLKRAGPPPILRPTCVFSKRSKSYKRTDVNQIIHTLARSLTLSFSLSLALSRSRSRSRSLSCSLVLGLARSLSFRSRSLSLVLARSRSLSLSLSRSRSRSRSISLVLGLSPFLPRSLCLPLSDKSTIIACAHSWRR